MMTNETESKGMDAYYAEKGKVRFMMVTTKESKAELTERCKAMSLSQGELLEVLLSFYDNIDPVAMSLAAQAKRAAKKANRVSFSSINQKLKGLTKEQLQAVEKAIEEVGKLAVS